MDEYKFYSYVDDTSILVCTKKNKLIRLKCPFTVMDLDNKISQVDAVICENNNMFYVIKGKMKFHRGFRIKI